MGWVLWHCFFFGSDFIAAIAGVTGIRSSLVIHQTPAITQECVLGRNRWASRLGLCGFRTRPLLFLFSSTASGGWECAPSKLSLRIVRVCWPGDSLGSPLIGLCQQPWLSPASATASAAQRLCWKQPGVILQHCSCFWQRWQLRQAARWLEIMKGTAGHWMNMGVLCKGLGTDVGISEDQAYAELVCKERPNQSWPEPSDGNRRDSFLELLSCALRYIGYAAKSMHGSYMSKTSSQQKPSPRKPRHWDS